MMRVQLTRGLAASAVATLAVSALAAGLPAPANAAGPGVVFMSLHNPGSDASVRLDGQDTAVSLVAMRLDPAATITFEYNLDPAAGDNSAGWTAVPGTVTMTDDYAELDWPPAAALLGTEVSVRAVATVGGTATYATRTGVAIARAEWGTESVAVNRAYQTPNGVGGGFFVQPYASAGRTATRLAVPNVTSATGGTAQVSWWNPATHVFQGTVDAAVSPFDLKDSSASSYVARGGEFFADLDITAFGAADGDTLAVGAVLDTDDVRTETLYAQTPSNIQASAPQVGAGQPTTVTIRVTDQNVFYPVAGVEVRRNDGTLVGYTDGAGEVRDQAVGGAIPSGYYANRVDDLDAYDATTDVASGSVDVYASTANNVAAVLADGRVFDDDEYAAGDVAVRVTDDNFAQVAVAGTGVEYRVYPTGSTPPATYQTATTDSRGLATVAFAPQGPDGDYTLDYRVPGNPDTTVTFTAGDGTLALTPATGVAAPGGQVTFRAGLTVAGKPLSSRNLAATYTRGVEQVPGQTADAGLVDGTNQVLSLGGTTDALGAFTVTVRDPAENPQGAETGGRLLLATVAAAGRLSLTGNANETAAAPVSFGAPRRLKVKIKLKGSSAASRDKLVVKGPDTVSGEKVNLFRVVNGKLRPLRSATLDAHGDAAFKVKDPNRARTTTYVVKLVPSDRVRVAKTKRLDLG